MLVGAHELDPILKAVKDHVLQAADPVLQQLMVPSCKQLMILSCKQLILPGMQLVSDCTASVTQPPPTLAVTC